MFTEKTAEKHWNSGIKMAVRICEASTDTFACYCFDWVNGNKLFLTNAFPDSCHRLPDKVE